MNISSSREKVVGPTLASLHHLCSPLLSLSLITRQNELPREHVQPERSNGAHHGRYEGNVSRPLFEHVEGLLLDGLAVDSLLQSHLPEQVPILSSYKSVSILISSESRTKRRIYQRDAKNLDTLTEIIKLGGEGYIVECDLSDMSEVKNLVRKVTRGSSKPVDILVNCGGIQRRYVPLSLTLVTVLIHRIRSPAENFTDEDWSDVRPSPRSLSIPSN